MTSVMEYQYWGFKNEVDFWPKATRFIGNFEVSWNGGMPSWQKLDIFLQNKWVQKMSTLKVVYLIQYYYKRIMLQSSQFLNKVKWSRKLKFSHFCHLFMPTFQKILKYPFNLVTVRKNHHNFVYPILIHQNQSHACVDLLRGRRRRSVLKIVFWSFFPCRLSIVWTR